jgi:hypothetical protein
MVVLKPANITLKTKQSTGPTADLSVLEVKGVINVHPVQVVCESSDFSINTL